MKVFEWLGWVENEPRFELCICSVYALPIEPRLGQVSADVVLSRGRMGPAERQKTKGGNRYCADVKLQFELRGQCSCADGKGYDCYLQLFNDP